MIPILAALVIGAAAPRTSPSPPPTILRERVSPVCSTLHQLVIPLAQMNLKDKPVIDAIRGARVQLAKYSGTRLGDGVFLYNSRIDMLYMKVLANLTDMDQYLDQVLSRVPARNQRQGRRVTAARAKCDGSRAAAGQRESCGLRGSG